MEQLDKVFDELKRICKGNEHLANQLFKALEDKSQAEK